MKQTTTAALKSQGNGNHLKEYTKLVVTLDNPWAKDAQGPTTKVNHLLKQFDQSIMGFTLGQLGTCIKYNAGPGIQTEVRGRCLFVSIKRGTEIIRIARIRFKS